MAFVLLLSLMLLTFNCSVAGEEQAENEHTVSAVPKATLKFNVPCLIDPLRSSLFVAADIRMAARWSADMGAGWFFGSWSNPHLYKGEGMNGLRVRLGVKYHYVVTRLIGPYIGVEGKMNGIRDIRYSQVCRFGCQYIEIMPVRYVTFNYGAAVKTGLQLYLGYKQRFLIDIYTGIGYRFIRKEMQLPEDAEILPAIQFSRLPGRYHTPDFLWGFYLGYCFAR
jgi:hypothetical protein